MADSDITVSNLAVTVGFGLNHATWTYSDPNANGLPHWKLDAVELWAATNNDRTQAAKVGEGETSAIHFGTNGAAQYYWTRARARNGEYGEWHPLSSTGGVAAAATVSLASEGWTKLPGGLILQWWSPDIAISDPPPSSVSFPMAFPNACFGVFPIGIGPFGTSIVRHVSVTSFTATSFTPLYRLIEDGGLVSDENTGFKFVFLAIGY